MNARVCWRPLVMGRPLPGAISRVLASPTLRDMWARWRPTRPDYARRASLSGMYNSIIALYGGSARRVVDSQPVASSGDFQRPLAEALVGKVRGERACRSGSGGHAGP
jgi:hypothetical protein